MTGHDLLILAAIDLSGGPEWFTGDWGRAVQALRLGRAGDVLHGTVPGAAFATRAAVAGLPDRKVQVRTRGFTRHDNGGYTLLSGTIYDPDDLCNRWGIDRQLDPAGLYAAMHARLGDDCDKHINGNYAAVQWNPERRQARLARSATSRAPLHVLRDGNRLVVSSLPAPIMALDHQAAIDDNMLGDWLLLNARRPAKSWYKGLHRVPAASVEAHDPDGHTTRQYWSVLDVPAVRFKKDEDYVEAVTEQFERATATMLAGARCPGVLLSGGLDSQAVASFAATQLPPGGVLRSYTSVPAPGWVPTDSETLFSDESPHVRALCAMYPQITPSFIDGAHLRFGERLQSSMLMSGWPSYNEMNAHWFHAALEQAAADGVDVVLGGDMGNASFSYDGFTGFPTWLAKGNWLRLIRELLADRYDARPTWRKLIALAVMPHVPLAVKRAVDSGRPWRPSPFTWWCPMREDYARRSGALDRAARDGHDLEAYDIASARQWRDEVVTGLLAGAPEISLGYTLLYGTEMRDPTAYVPLLELCAGIGDEQYLRGGVDRWLARRMLSGRVPDVVRDERRVGAQSSDWPMRMTRERDGMLHELQMMQSDPRLADVLDLPRLVADLQNWDGQDIAARRDAAKLNSGLTRGIATARFVQFVEGRNAG